MSDLRSLSPDPQSVIPDPCRSLSPDHESLIPDPCFACLYQPPARDDRNDAHDDRHVVTPNTLVAIAHEFSPRYERHRDDLVSIDVSGLGRLLGNPQTIGEELRREAAARAGRVHVALAARRMAALVLAHTRPGLTVVDPGSEAAALAAIPIGILENVYDDGIDARQSGRDRTSAAAAAIAVFKRWGLRTLGELAAVPRADLASRLGQPGLVCQAIARGEDVRPLIPTLPEERFESSIDLEWPIEGLEPLSFVLTRLLEPLSTRLERRDRGAAALHVLVRLVTREMHTRSLQLPSPMRDVRTLRTLALLDLESHPPPAAIDRVTIVIDPTPGRVLQHTLFTRPHPTPEQISTLVARLGAVMGHDRVGAPATVDSYRPDAFEMRPFATEHTKGAGQRNPDSAVAPVVCVLRRCRQPVPARVVVADERPVRVTSDRRAFAGGTVLNAAGPWRTSGAWWECEPGSGGSGKSGGLGTSWNRDEWDVALSDGAMYRIFRDRDSDGWFIDAIVD